MGWYYHTAFMWFTWICWDGNMLKSSGRSRRPTEGDILSLLTSSAWHMPERFSLKCGILAATPGNCSSHLPHRGCWQDSGENVLSPPRINSQRFLSLARSRLSLGWLVDCKCRQRTLDREWTQWRSCWCWGRSGWGCSPTRRSSSGL